MITTITSNQREAHSWHGKRLPHERKLRTREHVLADLSVNYVERQILLRGFAVNRLHSDYGTDLHMLTFSEGGEIENGSVLIQVKATDGLQLQKNERLISLRVEFADLKYWQDEWSPVILILYDGKMDAAYWQYVQQYLDEKNVTGDDLLADQDRVTVRIPIENRLDQRAIEEFRRIRNDHAKRMARGGKI